jgi:hypothetical protein
VAADSLSYELDTDEREGGHDPLSNGPASLVPITDEQAKLFREAVETLRSVGVT